MVNPLAEIDYPDSGKLVTIEEAEQLKKENEKIKFYCPDALCPDKERRLIPVLNTTNKIQHFRHHSGCEHLINGETPLHKIAKNRFKGYVEFFLPDVIDKSGKKIKDSWPLKIDKSKTRVEYKHHDVKPDVAIYGTNKERYYIEVFVTNETKLKKIQKIQGYKVPTIEIRLDDFYKMLSKEQRYDLDFLREEIDSLLSDNSRKYWLFPPKVEGSQLKFNYRKKQSDPDYSEWLIVGLIIGAILFIPKILKYIANKIIPKWLRR